MFRPHSQGLAQPGAQANFGIMSLPPEAQTRHPQPSEASLLSRKLILAQGSRCNPSAPYHHPEANPRTECSQQATENVAKNIKPLLLSPPIAGSQAPTPSISLFFPAHAPWLCPCSAGPKGAVPPSGLYRE